MMISIPTPTLRLVAIALLAASTLLFVVGAAVERSAGPASPSSSTSSEAGGHVEGSGAEGSAAHRDADGGATEQGPVGLDPEGIPAVAAAVLVSAAVGVGLWFWWHRPVVPIVATLFAAGFAVFDAPEVAHQVAIAQALVAVLAGSVMALHVATAASLAMLTRAASRYAGPAA
jgi:hypothetical protein